MPRVPKMVPVRYDPNFNSWYFDHLLHSEPRVFGLLAMWHALAQDLPGLWGDQELYPRSLLLVREGDGQLEAFGWGRANPAVRWLARLGLPTALVAPPRWNKTIDKVIASWEVGSVETWVATDSPTLMAAPTAATRRLSLDDAGAFAASAPSWALQGWMSFASLIAHGAAFGVPHGSGFASLAWIFDQGNYCDAVAVYTAPRFRRLGLARAATAALLGHIRNDRHKSPLWSTTPENTSSRALAQSFGFIPKVEETLVRWPGRGSRAPVKGAESAPQMTRKDAD